MKQLMCPKCGHVMRPRKPDKKKRQCWECKKDVEFKEFKIKIKR